MYKVPGNMHIYLEDEFHVLVYTGSSLLLMSLCIFYR